MKPGVMTSLPALALPALALPALALPTLALALALGGCFHVTALDRQLYGRIDNASGPTAAPLGRQAPVLVPKSEPAPPLRDPAVTATGGPKPPAGSAAPARPVAPTAPS